MGESEGAVIKLTRKKMDAIFYMNWSTITQNKHQILSVKACRSFL